jgi:mannose-1-phosphate guanylyltransferase
MQAFLLAAGFGTRVKPISNYFPKPLFPILNMPTIEYLISYFRSLGIVKFSVNTHHLPLNLEKAVKGLVPSDCSVSFSREKKILGTGGGIKRMLHKARMKPGETIIASNCDLVCNFDMDLIVEKHWKSGSAISLVFIPHRSGYSRVAVDSAGFVQSFLHRSPLTKGGVKYGLFTGIHILTKSLMPEMPDKASFCIIEDYYKPLVKNGYRINAIFAEGEWFDTGDLQKYKKTNDALLGRIQNFPILKGFLAAKYNQPRPGIFINKRFKLESEHIMRPPAIVGEKVLIGRNSRLGPKTIIGKASVIGDGAMIRNSILFPESKVAKHTSHNQELIFKNRCIKIGS